MSQTPETTPRASSSPDGEGKPGIGSYATTVAIVGLGVALIEEELLAGVAIGVAAMAFPSLMPRLTKVFRPLLKSAVRAGYGLADRTREVAAEMSEQFQDVVAEVRAENAEHDGAAVHESSDQESAAAPHNPANEAEPPSSKKSSRTNRPAPEAAP